MIDKTTLGAGRDRCERLAREIFEQAIAHNRCAEVQLSLFGGASCTLDPAGGLRVFWPEPSSVEATT